MAKKSSIEKTLRKQKLIQKFAKKRAELLKLMSETDSFEERMIIQKKIESLPSNSCKIRHRNRCWLTGRPRGFHRDFGICRNALRIMAHDGQIPGLSKASW